jgi:hypothetical protein
MSRDRRQNSKLDNQRAAGTCKVAAGGGVLAGVGVDRQSAVPLVIFHLP